MAATLAFFYWTCIRIDFVQDILMISTKKNKKYSSISQRLILYIVLCSSALTVLLTAFQLYRDYQTDIDQIEEAFNSIERVHIATVSESLWGSDLDNLETIVRGMSNLRDLSYIAILEDEYTLIKFGRLPKNEFKSKTFPLLYDRFGSKEEIGKLVVVFDLSTVNQRLLDRIFIILGSNTLKTGLVIIFTILIFRQLIARHLEQISKYLLRLEIGKKNKHLILNRQFTQPSNKDELDLVVDSINEFLSDNEAYVTELEQRHEELFTQGQIISNMLEGAALVRASDATILYTNPAFDSMFGYETGEVIGKHVSILNASTDITPIEQAESIHKDLKTHGFWKDDICNIKKDGTRFWCSLHISEFNHPTYGKVWVSMNVDITDRKKMDAKLSYQASHDALTDLISRYEFELRVTRLLSSLSKEKSAHAMCFLDLDQFKVINDTCGHAAGDELLRQLGRTLQKTIRKRDTLARLGGDEFGVLMEHCTLEQAHRVADNILRVVMDYQFSWDGKIFRIGVSIGLVAITETSGNFTDLLKQADAACYLAKDLGRNRVHAYHPDDTELAVRHGEMQWVGRINHALDENQLCLYAQPIILLDGDGDGRSHYELLVRMLDQYGDIIPPGAFLPAAERYNLIEKLDAWVVSHACTSLAAHNAFIDQVDFFTINLSGPSLTNQSFLESILSIFKETGVSPEKICFEVTETVAVSNLDSAISFIKNLKKIGCQFALDDFGSGISSFGYLKNLPVDYLKIDGMFVKDIVDDPIDRAMVKSINEIGQVMGMKTIAEFVENDDIKMMLKAIGVNYGQGYGLGKPEPLVDLITRFNET